MHRSLRPIGLDVAALPTSTLGHGLLALMLLAVLAGLLTPSFARAELLFNPNAWDRFTGRIRNAVIGFLSEWRARQSMAALRAMGYVQ